MTNAYVSPNIKKINEFQKELEQLINKYSFENMSNTPDFILAEYMVTSMITFTTTSINREKWFGHALMIGGPNQLIT